MSGDQRESGINKLDTTSHRKSISFPTTQFRVKLVKNKGEIRFLIIWFERKAKVVTMKI